MTLPYQELLAGAPHIVHTLEHLPVLQKGKEPDVVGALGHRVQPGGWLLGTQVPTIQRRGREGREQMEGEHGGERDCRIRSEQGSEYVKGERVGK